jgi:hypothetical protein
LEQSQDIRVGVPPVVVSDKVNIQALVEQLIASRLYIWTENCIHIKPHRFNRHSALCRSEDKELIAKPYWFPALGRDVRDVADVPKPQRNWTTSQKNNFLLFPLRW